VEGHMYTILQETVDALGFAAIGRDMPYVEASSGDTIRNLAVTTHTTSQKRAENNGKSYV